MEIQIRGANELEAVAKRLKEAGRGDLRKELLRGIRESAKPTIRDIKSNAAEVLPKRGGLADKIAKSRIGVRTNTGGKRVGVRIEAKNDIDLRSLDRGRLRHPVFGNRNNWVNQQIEPGWFSEPIDKNKEQIQHEVLKAMDTVAKKVEG